MLSFEVFGYLATLVMGLVLGLMGGGGSILTVPILVYLFAETPLLATAYSLFIVGLTALVGGFFFLKKGLVNLKVGLVFAVPSFVGVYLVRAYVLPNLPESLFSVGSLEFTKDLFVMLSFSVIMLLASLSMLSSKGKSLAPEKATEAVTDRATQTAVETAPKRTTKAMPKTTLTTLKTSSLKTGLVIGAEGLVVGGVTGFVGAGGGFLIIPALVVLIGLPVKVAIGTSLLIISFKSLLGFMGDVQTQEFIDWIFLLSLSTLSVLGLFFGMALSKRFSDRHLKVGFAYFVLLMGLAITADQILGRL